MANTNPRRNKQARPKPAKGDPTRFYGLNTPIPEPLMLQLDWLVENRVIRSKAQFIRDTVSAAAEQAIQDQQEIQEAARQIMARRRAPSGS